MHLRLPVPWTGISGVRSCGESAAAGVSWTAGPDGRAPDGMSALVFFFGLESTCRTGEELGRLLVPGVRRDMEGCDTRTGGDACVRSMWRGGLSSGTILLVDGMGSVFVGEGVTGG